jgi:hypothetical protein
MSDQCKDTSLFLAVTEEQIAKRAYELWEARGCPQGDGSNDWQVAKSQLIAENRRSLANASQAGIDLAGDTMARAHAESDCHQSGSHRRRGLLSRWMALLKKAG